MRGELAPQLLAAPHRPCRNYALRFPSPFHLPKPHTPSPLFPLLGPLHVAQVSVLNGEKYKEICPDNTLLSPQHLHSCIISHHPKALLRRDGGSDEQLQCYLQLEASSFMALDIFCPLM